MLAKLLDTRFIETRLRLINLITTGSAFLLAAILLTAQRVASEEAHLLVDARQKALLVARNSEMLTHGGTIAGVCGQLLAEIEREYARVDQSMLQLLATTGRGR